jgi:hypothetical protein
MAAPAEALTYHQTTAPVVQEETIVSAQVAACQTLVLARTVVVEQVVVVLQAVLLLMVTEVKAVPALNGLLHMVLEEVAVLLLNRAALLSLVVQAEHMVEGVVAQV